MTRSKVNAGSVKRSLLLLAALLLGASVWVGAQNPPVPPETVPKSPAGPFNWLVGPYAGKTLPPVPLENTLRIQSLIRGGYMYLSLSDAVALALENNLDLELQRYGISVARTDILRTRGGGSTRGVSLTAVEVPAGIGGPNSPLLNAAATTFPFTASVPASVSDLAAIATSATNLSIAPPANGFAFGPPIPIFDPTILASASWNHQTTPQSSPFLTGTTTLITRTIPQSFSYQQGFSPGTLLGLTYTANSQHTTSIRSAFNPFTTASLGLTLTQPLLRGFGTKVNKRYIRIAKNDLLISDQVLRQQAISTVSGVIRLYWDLVSLREDARVKQQTVDLARKLYTDTEAQVKAGTQAPIELVRARAQVAAAEEDLINASAFLREQELILKNVLTRRGIAEPAIRDALIIPTDMVPTPPAAPVVLPVPDLVAEALKNRPDVLAASLQIANAQISLEGSRNELRPELDVFVTALNSGLAGTPAGALTAPPDPFFVGGYGLAVEQIFRRNFPTYGAGINLNLPLRNRVAQADYSRDLLTYRQTQIRQQQLENQVRLEVEDAVVALERARAAYQAAALTAKLQEESLASEQKKFAAGLSTEFLVGQYQSFLAQARSTEVAAKGAYAKAVVALRRSLGLTLEDNNITIDEASTGQVKRPPTPLPSALPAPLPTPLPRPR